MLLHAGYIYDKLDFYPDNRDKILSDYSFSIKYTYRSIIQVLNLECLIRYCESENIEGCFVETGTFTGGASAYALRALMRLRKDKPFRSYWGFDYLRVCQFPVIWMVILQVCGY